jgi:HK97 family phage major capsid protein
VAEETRTIKPEVTREVIGKRQERRFTITRREMVIDQESRTVEISFSSEFPVERWWGTEILDHTADAVMLDRLNSSGPYLNNHDTDQKIGWVVPDSASVDTADKKCRCTVRYSKRQEAEDEWQDVLDGAPLTVSVGYMIHELQLTESSDDTGDIYRATKWEPFEVSAAPVPADTTVGGGRSQGSDAPPPKPSGEESQTSTRAAEDATTQAVTSTTPTQEEERATNMTTAATATEEQRTGAPPSAQEDDSLAAYLRMGEFFGEVELAREFYAGDKTVEEFKAAILDKYRKQQEQLRTRKPLIQFSDREREAYSITSALLADANSRSASGERMTGVEAGFEQEVSETLEREIVRSIPGYKSMGGVLIPTSIPLRGIPGVAHRTPLTTGGSTTGQKIVFTEAGSFIDLLRHRAMLLRLGATVLAGLQGNVAFPKQTGAGQVYWTGENPGSDVTESNITIAQVTLSPKTAQATQAYSRQLLAQGVVNADALVTTDLARINALEVDRVGMHGSGSSGQPLGVYGASGVNAVAFGGTITYDKAVDMETAIANADADIGTMAYITTPTVRGKGKKTAILNNTSALPLWTGNNETGEMNSYRAVATNQVASNLGVGTNEHGLVFGVWEHLFLGEWGVMELITDPYAKKKQGLIEVTSFLMVDWAIRYAEAFCKATGLIP